MLGRSGRHLHAGLGVLKPSLMPCNNAALKALLHPWSYREVVVFIVCCKDVVGGRRRTLVLHI